MAAEYIQVSAKTVDEAVTKATMQLEITSDKLEYEVVEKGSSGVFGFGSKPAIIKARKKMDFMDYGKEFLENILSKMEIEAEVEMKYVEEEKTVEININGEDMGVLIGKRGQTLDSIQYLVSLVLNKYSEEYVRVKLDTENYRERRKETLEALAKRIAYKVKSTQRSVSLEPMNPYERRIIHSALQDDKYVYTKSEGEEPFRYVVVMLKKEAKGGRSYSKYGSSGSGYGRSKYSGYGKKYDKKPYYSDNYESSESESESEEASDNE